MSLCAGFRSASINHLAYTLIGLVRFVAYNILNIFNNVVVSTARSTGARSKRQDVRTPFESPPFSHAHSDIIYSSFLDSEPLKIVPSDSPERSFYVHKALLCSASPEMESYVASKLRGGVNEMRIGDFDEATTEQFLLWVYRTKVPPETAAAVSPSASAPAKYFSNLYFLFISVLCAAQSKLGTNSLCNGMTKGRSRFGP